MQFWTCFNWLGFQDLLQCGGMTDRTKQSQVIGGKSIFILVYEGKGNGGKSKEVAILFQ